MSKGNISDNKRIAKNAMALYFRMFVMMAISLFTSRVVLNALGVTDYGIYNVVGGFVSMFSLVSSSLNASISRTLTFELGTADMERLKRTFSTSIYVLFGLAVILVILFEVIGVWYIETKMVLPPERLNAAYWCFHLSMFTFLLRLINSPYSASIVSHEKMEIYAYFTILDAIFKLLICYLVPRAPFDRLIFYAILLVIISVVNQAIYVTYCKRHFEECHFNWVFDKQLFKGLFSFAGWNFIGSSSVILRTQGATLLLNWAGGPVLNAANGIAHSITSIVTSFVGNFTTAFMPQITKRYAAKEYESLMSLLLWSSRFSFYVMLLLSLPIIFNCHFIVYIWLGQVPDHTVMFVRWIVIYLMANAISRPIITAKNATGVIRNYQIVVGGILLTMLPLSYLGLKLGLPVEIVPFTNALTACLAVLARMYMLRGDFPCWSSRIFVKKVLLNAVLVTLVAMPLPFITYKLLDYGWVNFLITSTLCVVCSSLSILYVGCSKDERTMLVSKAHNLLENIIQKIHHA